MTDQLTEADVRRLYAQGNYAEIVQAKADGRLDDYLTTPTTDTTDERNDR